MERQRTEEKEKEQKRKKKPTIIKLSSWDNQLSNVYPRSGNDSTTCDRRSLYREKKGTSS
eukprot:m.39513 g.39513  ORF g.39513 m.39513 type:complete len:60 (-) comp11614_c0_seq1:725-904(-)